MKDRVHVVMDVLGITDSQVWFTWQVTKPGLANNLRRRCTDNGLILSGENFVFYFDVWPCENSTGERIARSKLVSICSEVVLKMRGHDSAIKTTCLLDDDYIEPRSLSEFLRNRRYD